MRDICQGETHFDAGECSGQHEIVEAAQMSDAEDLPLEFCKAGPKGHVEFLEYNFSKLIGIVTGRHKNRCDGIRIFVGALTDDFQTPSAHRRASGFAMAPMPGEDIG